MNHGAGDVVRHEAPDGHHVPEVPARAARSRIAMTRDELVAWGEAFGRAARPPLVIALAGELGAGKTTLTQAICRGMGVRDEVTSPTYALVHEYASPLARVFHLDLYRLKHEDELTNLGWDDVVSADDAIVIVEWPERAGTRLPPHVSIDLEHIPGDDTRRLLLAG